MAQVQTFATGNLADRDFGPEMARGVADLYRGWQAASSGGADAMDGAKG